jgi:hypothetical protein
MLREIFVDKEIITYTDYLISNKQDDNYQEIITQTPLKRTLLTYRDAIPINEADFFNDDHIF